MKRFLTAAGVTLGAAALMIAGIAGPASADGTTEPAPNAAFSEWLATDSGTSVSVAASTESASAAASPAAASTGGERLTDKHGGIFLWTANTLEWYFNSKAITTSYGSQTFGFIFPNTASKGGISRNLKTSLEHNWRGTMNVGEGTVTPWGAVNLFSTSRTDYYELFLKGKYEISE
jgi:hypothetical protein